MSAAFTIYHIPVCPFSQRVEILLDIRGQRDAVRFEIVDITKPRDASLLAKTRGTTSLPVLELADGRIIKESLVILRYLDEVLPGQTLRRRDPAEHAIESMLVALESPLADAGYRFMMNTDRAAQGAFEGRYLAICQRINDMLDHHNPEGPFLFEAFGLAEAVLVPLFQRFWALGYYDGFALPQTDAFTRLNRWYAAAMAHPQAQQVCEEEVIKLYYDYAMGAGNGALVDGRSLSSFVFTPDWRSRPWPPRDKFAGTASDAALGLLA